MVKSYAGYRTDTLLARHMTQWGSSVYGLLLSGLGFLAGWLLDRAYRLVRYFRKCRWHLLKCCMNASVLVGLAAMMVDGAGKSVEAIISYAIYVFFSEYYQ